MQNMFRKHGLARRLVALLAALLAAVAVTLAARSFAARRLDDCAMLRVLGVPQRTMAVGSKLAICSLSPCLSATSWMALLRFLLMTACASK